MPLSRRSVFSLLLAAFGCSPALAQINPAYEVATWRQFKAAAVSYTMDDNNTNQLAVAVPLFDQFNFKTTLFTVTAWNPNWTGLRAASANGHEIASHTVTHTILPNLTVPRQEIEMGQSQAAIRANVPTAKCETIAYPNCFTGDLTALTTYYLAGRRCSDILNPSSPPDFFNINSIITGAVGWVQTAASLNNQVTAARATNGWCVFTLHGIDNDGGYSPTQSTELAAHLTYVQANAADYWVGTFAEVAKYIKERDAAAVTETVVSADTLRLTVSDNLPDATFNVPLTVRRRLPAGWADARVWDGATPVPASLVVSGGTTYVVFEATPDHGPLHLTRFGAPTGLPTAATPNLVKSWPNPFTDYATLEVAGRFSFAIYSLDGKLVETGTGQDVATVGRALAPGTYSVRITQGATVVGATIVKR